MYYIILHCRCINHQHRGWANMYNTSRWHQSTVSRVSKVGLGIVLGLGPCFMVSGFRVRVKFHWSTCVP